MWIIDSANDRLLRISAGSGALSPPIEVSGRPTAVTTGFGYAWVAQREGTVQRIDPATIEPVGAPIPVGAGPSALVSGNGYVWSGNAADSTVTRIEPR